MLQHRIDDCTCATQSQYRVILLFAFAPRAGIINDNLYSTQTHTSAQMEFYKIFKIVKNKNETNKQKKLLIMCVCVFVPTAKKRISKQKLNLTPQCFTLQKRITQEKNTDEFNEICYYLVHNHKFSSSATMNNASSMKCNGIDC